MNHNHHKTQNKKWKIKSISNEQLKHKYNNLNEFLMPNFAIIFGLILQEF